MRVALGATALVALACCSDPTGSRDDEGPVLWSVAAGTIETRPLILDDLLVFGTLDGAAVALDRATGATAWRTQLAEGEFFGNQPAAAGAVALLPHHELWALDSRSGSVLWHYGGPDGWAGGRDPVTSGDTVFTSSPLGWVSSLDAATGQVYWTRDLEEAVFPPVITGDLVIFSTRGFFGPQDRSGPLGAGHVVALRRTDGTEAWRYSLPDSAGFQLSGGATSSGVVWHDRVIIGTKAAAVVALRLADGTELWSKPNGAPPPTSAYDLSPALVDDVVVLGRADHVWEGWDASGGARLWTHAAPVAVCPPISVAGLVYYLQGPLEIGDAHGEVLWSYGGLDAAWPYGGTSYWFGDVSADGVIYTLANSELRSRGTTLVYALRPPLTR